MESEGNPTSGSSTDELTFDVNGRQLRLRVGAGDHDPRTAAALLASASPQIRHLATVRGNLLRRTHCGYFRDAAMPGNKRIPRSGCPAIHGQNRMHAVLGISDGCIATYVGDLATAPIVLDATVKIARHCAACRNAAAPGRIHHQDRYSDGPGRGPLAPRGIPD